MSNENNVDQIRVGIVGLGRSGWGIHANGLSRLADHFSIVAVCDPDKERQEEAKARFGCSTYDDYTDLVADDKVELVVVANPSQLHCQTSIAAMRAGKHVIVEKPMAPSLAEVDEMIAVSKETGQLLTGFQNYRYDSDFLKIKEVLESGVLGRPVLIRFTDHKFCRRWDWQTLKRFGGGLLNNMGPHLIDWALLLVDDPEPEVLAHMETTPLCAGDAESHVKLIMRPENGPMIDIEITQTNAYPQESFLVMGTQGSLTGNRKVVRWKYFKPEDVAPLVLDTIANLSPVSCFFIEVYTRPFVRARRWPSPRKVSAARLWCWRSVGSRVGCRYIWKYKSRFMAS
jgi:predicted dehydrogenase